MRILKIIIPPLFFIMLISCVERNGYYEPGQKAIIENLTFNKRWERSYHAKLDNGKEFDVHEFWIFNDNASGSYKTITTYDNGEKEEIVTYFRWTFTTPNFSVIYMDYGLYWEIKKLTKEDLFVYETHRDPITVPSQQYRDYREYHSFQIASP